MASESTMKVPICLVGNWKEQLLVNPEAIQILDKISQPLVVVAIVGLYRTGKSYLMNRLAGKTMASPWAPPYSLKPRASGCGDPKNDSWIFALAVLLSSTFVYNSIGTINNKSLEQLYYVTELTQLIRAKSSPSHDEVGDSSGFVSFFPDFVWTVRDFTLELKINGRPVTEDEYLENALKLLPGENPEVQNANLSRECIKSFFPEQKCFVFDRPTSNRKLLSQIEKVPENQLEWDFQVESKEFLFLYLHPCKDQNPHRGIAVTGNRLGSLVKTYVDAINTGTVPCLENAVMTLAQRENSMAVQKAAEHYSEQMVRCMWLPTDTVQELLDLHTACKREAIAVFMEHSFKDDEQEFQKRLVATIEKRKEDFLVQNEAASLTRCQVKLQKLSGHLMRSISRGAFCVPGGYRLYIEAKRKVEWRYEQMPRKGVKANDVLQSFLQSQAAIENSILQADKALNDGQRALTALQTKNEAAQKKQQLLRQEQKRQQKGRDSQERRFQRNIVQLQEKMGRQTERLQREQGKTLEYKLREYNVKRLGAYGTRDHPRNRPTAYVRQGSAVQTTLCLPQDQRLPQEQASGFCRHRKRQGNRPAFGRAYTAGGTGFKPPGDQKLQQEPATSFSETRGHLNRALASVGTESTKRTDPRPLWYQRPQQEQASSICKTRDPHATKPWASSGPETARKTELPLPKDKRTQYKPSFSQNREYRPRRPPASEGPRHTVQTDHHLPREQRPPSKQASGFCRTRKQSTNRLLASSRPESTAQTCLLESTRKQLESTKIY